MEQTTKQIIEALAPTSYAQVKELIEAIDNRAYTEDDFQLDFGGCEYRVINCNEIDSVMREELLNDLYVLGCCSDWFIADMCDLSIVVVQDAQNAESFELLGALMAKNIYSVQEQMVCHDGYGHHFNHYDGDCIETSDLYIFRPN